MDKCKNQPDIDITEAGTGRKCSGLDLIRRQDAIDAMYDLVDGTKRPENQKGNPHIYQIVDALERVPSAEPRCIATIHLSQEQLDEAFEKVKADILSVKPKTGKWIGGELGECSVCGHKGCASDIWDRCKEHFCPNCGARLEE